MITLLTYLYYSLWGLETDKLFWASVSTFEIAIEFGGLIGYLIIYQPWRKDF